MARYLAAGARRFVCRPTAVGLRLGNRMERIADLIPALQALCRACRRGRPESGPGVQAVGQPTNSPTAVFSSFSPFFASVKNIPVLGSV